MTVVPDRDEARAATFRKVFRIGLFVKAADSILELVGGFALFIASNDTILRAAEGITRHRLLHDPDDAIANFVLRSAESLSIGHKSAAALYLASHGAIKLFLVIMVLRDRAWAYPAFMIALTLLIAYQCYQLTLGFSPVLAVLTVFDIVILWMTLVEYRQHRRQRITAGAGA